MIIAYDTETTGLPLWKEPSDHPGQPHIVELAAILVDADMTELDRLRVLVRPDGWMIPEEAAAVHGITTERAMDEGVPEREAVEAFLGLTQRAKVRVAHNEPFDQRIIRIAMKRHGWSEAEQELWRTAPHPSCTMRLCTPRCKLPPTAAMARLGRRYKVPTLAEAYAHMFPGEALQNAHSALADAEACLRIFGAIDRAPAVACHE